jgi:hypothetical protein
MFVSQRDNAGILGIQPFPYAEKVAWRRKSAMRARLFLEGV